MCLKGKSGQRVLYEGINCANGRRGFGVSGCGASGLACSDWRHDVRRSKQIELRNRRRTTTFAEPKGRLDQTFVVGGKISSLFIGRRSRSERAAICGPIASPLSIRQGNYSAHASSNSPGSTNVIRSPAVLSTIKPVNIELVCGRHVTKHLG